MTDKPLENTLSNSVTNNENGGIASMDARKVGWYKEFFEINKELFKKDIFAYWSECTRYVENKRIEYESKQRNKK